VEFFDCNVQIGRFGNPQPEYPLTAREILEKLAPLKVTRALAFHALGKELHPNEGNTVVLEETAGSPLEPCWVAMPHHTGEFPHPSELVARMQENRVRAVRLFPSAHQYSLSEWCAGEMLATFEAHRVPVFVEASQTSYDHIAGVLNAFPALRLVVVQPSYRCDRYVYPLMERYEHLAIDTSNYVVTGGIEALCRRFGPSRLVFGSALPFFEPGGPVSMITLADISDDDKQMIACGNLARLLEWTQ